MTPNELRTKIEAEIQSFLNRHTIKILLRDTVDRQRTKLIKDHLCKLGKELGYRVAASGCDADDGEWLYGMVWFNLSEDDKLLTHQAVVMESEWKWSSYEQAAEVDLDFQKLIQARADVRVWICAMPNEHFAKEKIKNCKEQIEKFTQAMPDDHYLFVVLGWENHSHIVERYPPLPVGQR